MGWQQWGGVGSMYSAAGSCWVRALAGHGQGAGVQGMARLSGSLMGCGAGALLALASPWLAGSIGLWL